MTANKRPIIVAVAAAVAFMLVNGTVYRASARYLARPTDSVPLPAEALAALPMHLGDWSGRDVPLDEAIVRASDTDALVNRVYSRRTGIESVGLFVAYGVRARDLMPHRPEVCYPGAGWTLRETQTAEVVLPNRSTLECRIYQFSRAGLTSQRVTVLNYYIVDGQYSADESSLRSRAWRGSSGIRYMAQVQITCSGSAFRGQASAVKSVCLFATESGPAIRDLFPDTAESSFMKDDPLPAAEETVGDKD